MTSANSLTPAMNYDDDDWIFPIKHNTENMLAPCFLYTPYSWRTLRDKQHLNWNFFIYIQISEDVLKP